MVELSTQQPKIEGSNLTTVLLEKTCCPELNKFITENLLWNDLQLQLQLFTMMCKQLPYFIEYDAHNNYSAHLNFKMILGKKNYFLFFKNNFTKINHCKFIHHKSHLKPFHIQHHFQCKKWALYSIKYLTFTKVIKNATLCQSVKLSLFLIR